MTDMETIHYNLMAGENAVREIAVAAAEQRFSDVNQVAAAEQSLCEIAAKAEEMHNFIVASLDDVNLVIAARNDPNQIVGRLIDGCNNLRSDASLLYNAIAGNYHVDILADNQVAASQQVQQPLQDNAYAQNYLTGQMGANTGIYGDVNEIAASSNNPGEMFNFFAK